MKVTEIVDTVKLKSYSIIALLPQSPETIIVDPKTCIHILKLLYHSIALLIEAIDQFYIQKNYLYFDPHVGENACQIRAYMFWLLSKRKYSNKAHERIQLLKTKQIKLQNIMNGKVVYKMDGRNLTVHELLLKYNLDFCLSLSEVFLYQSYFLTVFRKEKNELFYIDKEYISNHLKISKFLAKKIVYQYQAFLSKLSCVFIRKIFPDIGFRKKDYNNLLSSISYRDGRMVYPCFFYSKIIFMHMIKNECPVLIIVETLNDTDSRKDFILFEGGNDQGYWLTQNNLPTKEELGIVVVCNRIAAEPLSSQALIKILNDFGWYDILLMNMAAHPQVGGFRSVSLINHIVPDTIKLTATEKAIEAEFFVFKKKASKYGFCLENPSLLWAKHIFMDSIRNQMNLQQNNNSYISVRESIDI